MKRILAIMVLHATASCGRNQGTAETAPHDVDVPTLVAPADPPPDAAAPQDVPPDVAAPQDVPELAARWTFDEGAGTTAGDVSGGGNTATLIGGPSWSAGTMGGALSFDGSDDGLSVTGAVATSNMPAFTFAAWISPNAGGATYGRIISKESANGFDGSYFYVRVDDAGATLGAVLYDVTGVSSETVATSGSVRLDAWQYVALAYDDGHDRRAHLYVNGRELSYASQPTLPGALSGNTGTFYIGNRVAGDRSIRGYLDDVRVYRRALSGAELTPSTDDAEEDAYVDPDCSAGLVCSPKGKWGHVTAMADGNHPNLYYNQSEIDELRAMVFVQHNPPLLWDLWNTAIKDARAVGPASHYYPDNENLRAALSYMLEPSDAKADDIRAALLEFMTVFPRGGGTDNGGDVWWDNGGKTKGWGLSGYSVPWLFDLILAYHPEKLSASERVELKEWFHLTAGVAHTRYWQTGVSGGPEILTREGKTIAGYANWWSRYMANGLASALVSGNQADVDYWIDSGWPHDRPYFDGSWEPTAEQNQFDMTMYLLAVFPSGANEDSYTRESYRLPESDWYTVDYSRGIYHFAQMYGVIMGAEAAFHNGMTRVFEVTDAGSEPALLRTYKRAISSRAEVDRQPCYRGYAENACIPNDFGHPIIGWDPIIYLGNRHYADPLVESAVPELVTDSSDPLFGFFSYDLDPFVLAFMGYPRRVVWPR